MAPMNILVINSVLAISWSIIWSSRNIISKIKRKWFDPQQNLLNEPDYWFIDLIIVSVLLDAGAGDIWKFKCIETNKVFNRSEGLAIASLYMFKEGKFSSNKQVKSVQTKLYSLRYIFLVSCVAKILLCIADTLIL